MSVSENIEKTTFLEMKTPTSTRMGHVSEERCRCRCATRPTKSSQKLAGRANPRSPRKTSSTPTATGNQLGLARRGFLWRCNSSPARATSAWSDLPCFLVTGGGGGAKRRIAALAVRLFASLPAGQGLDETMPIFFITGIEEFHTNHETTEITWKEG